MTGGLTLDPLHFHRPQDKKWVGERTSAEFSGKVSGEIGRVELKGATFAGNPDSEIQIDEMHGEDVEEFDKSSHVGLSAGYAPGDAVPFMTEPDLARSRQPGKMHSYSNLPANQKSGVVDDKDKMHEVGKKTGWHVRFILPIVNRQEVKQAVDKYKKLFEKQKVSPKEHKEAIEEIKKQAGIDKFFNDESSESAEADSEESSSEEHADQADTNADESRSQQEPQKPEQQQEERQEQGFDDLEVHDGDDNDKPDFHDHEPKNREKPATSTPAEQPQATQEDIGATIDLTEFKIGDNADDQIKVRLSETTGFDTYGAEPAACQTTDSVTPDGKIQLNFMWGASESIDLTGSLAELNLAATQMEAFVEDRFDDAIIYAGPTTLDAVEAKFYKVLNALDHVFPIKDGYTLATGRNWDTGCKYIGQRASRFYALCKICATVASAKVATIVISKYGTPALVWLSKTKTGQKITKAVKPFFDAAGKKAKCTWNRASNWLGEAFGYEAEYVEGKVAGDAAEAVAENVDNNWILNKLDQYLLNPQHPKGSSKADWFQKALGFNRDNMGELAAQLRFNPSKAIQTEVTEYGIKYNQLIKIVGKNGRAIDVKTAWIKNNDGIIRFITATPGDL